MANFVLAIGVVMSLAGGAEIFYGTGYIDVERGWSAFIAGTILLTGGLVTLAIGMAVRSLLAMQGVMQALVQTGPQALAGFDLRHAEPGSPSLGAREAPLVLPVAPVLSLHGAGPTGYADPREPYFDNAPAAHPSAVPAPVEQLAPLVLAEAAVHEAATVHPHAEPVAPYAAPLDDAHPPVQTHAPDRPAEALVPAEMIDPSLATDDWLDRSFADLGPASIEHVPAEAHDHQGHEMSPAHEEPAEPLGGTSAPAHADEAVHHAPEPGAPAVIGRYEADGTSYVMFADGSIEAQSAAGVYRFASMTELKSFIEN